MNETICSFTELLWRDFFIGKEVEYEDKNGITSWETIIDLNFVAKTRLLKVETMTGKIFTMHKDDDQKFKTPYVKIKKATNKPRNKRKK